MSGDKNTKLDESNVRNDYWVQTLRGFLSFADNECLNLYITGKYILYKLHGMNRECNLDLLVSLGNRLNMEEFLLLFSRYLINNGYRTTYMSISDDRVILSIYSFDKSYRINIHCVFGELNKENVSFLTTDNIYYDIRNDIHHVFSNDVEYLTIQANSGFAQNVLFHPAIAIRAIKYSVEFGSNISFYILGVLNRILNDDVKFKIFRESFKNSFEEVREELLDIMMSNHSSVVITKLNNYKLLSCFMPEISDLINFKQNKRCSNNVFDHTMRVLESCPNNLLVKFAALYHDCGKPSTMLSTNGGVSYYNHEIVGADIARRSLNRLGFSMDFCEQVSHIIKYHMYIEGLIKDDVSDDAIKRFIAKSGKLQRHIMLLAIADKLSNIINKDNSLFFLERYYKFYYRMDKMLPRLEYSDES
jgi:putative nucleotidyltransferase with HDIG domain